MKGIRSSYLALGLAFFLTNFVLLENVPMYLRVLASAFFASICILYSLNFLPINKLVSLSQKMFLVALILLPTYFWKDDAVAGIFMFIILPLYLFSSVLLVAGFMGSIFKKLKDKTIITEN